MRTVVYVCVCVCTRGADTDGEGGMSGPRADPENTIHQGEMEREMGE